MTWREQALRNVLAEAEANGETLTPKQIRRRVRNRLAWRVIGTVGIGAAKVAGGAVGGIIALVGEATQKTITRGK